MTPVPTLVHAATQRLDMRHVAAVSCMHHAASLQDGVFRRANPNNKDTCVEGGPLMPAHLPKQPAALLLHARHSRLQCPSLVNGPRSQGFSRLHSNVG